MFTFKIFIDLRKKLFSSNKPVPNLAKSCLWLHVACSTLWNLQSSDITFLVCSEWTALISLERESSLKVGEIKNWENLIEWLSLWHSWMLFIMSYYTKISFEHTITYSLNQKIALRYYFVLVITHDLLNITLV